MEAGEHALTTFAWANIILTYVLVFALYLPELFNDVQSRSIEMLPKAQFCDHAIGLLETGSEKIVQSPPVTVPYTVLCIESAYKNLLSIINDETDYFAHFVGICEALKLLCNDKEVRSLFRVVQREQGPLLLHVFQRKRIDLAAYLLKEFDPRERYEGRLVWMSALNCENLINLLLTDGRVLHYEIFCAALKNKHFESIITVVSHPGFDSSKFPFLLHELLRHNVPRPLIKEIYLKGSFRAVSFHHFNLYLPHFHAVKENYQRAKRRNELSLFTTIFEMAKPRFTRPEEAAILVHLRRNILDFERLVHDYDVMIEAFQDNPQGEHLRLLSKMVRVSQVYLSKAEVKSLADLPLLSQAKHISHLLLEKALVLSENAIRTLRSK